jgi:branched-chain amino acid transport system ATP-binding protein
MAIATATSLDVYVGGKLLFADVSFKLEPRERMTLSGRNGAGKSTLLKTVIGIAPPGAGSIRVAGENTAGFASAEIARRGIGYVPQGRGLFAGMTVADNLALGRLKRMTGSGIHWDDDRIASYFPRLTQRWHSPADYLSGGEQQMLAVARALAGDVRVLLLDEPFEGLSPAVTEELFEAFDRLRYDVAIVIVDHHLDLALALSDRTVVLERGAVTWTGPSHALRDDLALRRKMLWM